MFYTILNTKGGVGKTTITQQIVAPYLYDTTNEIVEVFEIDNNNKSDSLKDSVIMNIVSINTQKGSEIIKDKFFEVIADDKDVVVDAGGGEDTKEVLQVIKDLELTDEVIFFIPVLKNQANIKNVADTYKLIREWNKNSKIFFVLNMFSNDKDFVYFFGDEKLSIEGIYSVISKDENADILKIKNTRTFDLVENQLHKTTYEIGKVEIDTKSYLKEIIKKGDKAKYKKELAYIELYKEAREFYLSDIIPAFQIIGR